MTFLEGVLMVVIIFMAWKLDRYRNDRNKWRNLAREVLRQLREGPC